MPAWRRSKKSMGERAKKRRLVALNGLENDLKSGVSRSKIVVQDGDLPAHPAPLTDYDIKRIKKEMENIKKRL